MSEGIIYYIILSLYTNIIYECCCQSFSNQTNKSSSQPRFLQTEASYQLADHSGAEKLEAPPSMRHQFIEGPGIDLVALNRRRFELEHNHRGSSLGENELRRSELIESKVAAIPDRFLNNLPEDVSKQIFDTFATDPTLIMGLPAINEMASGSEDPDGASIERLTKSCLTVHASSARPEQLNVTFHLYTKNNPLIPFILRPQISRLELIKSSPFNPARPIKWITHGFHTNVDKSEWMLEAKDKILAFEDANVILTDWRRGASPALAFYPKAAANAHVVAKLIVKILRRLRDDIDYGRVHLIGHSLGAHIMGFVGSAFTEEYLHQQQQLMMLRTSLGQESAQVDSSRLVANQLIGRITACDPALPCFGPTSSTANSQANAHAPVTRTTSTSQSYQTTTPSSSGSSERPALSIMDWTPSMWTHLRPDSAIVVEVMHSNPGVMGYSEPLGDYDFYPNGFERQPGCGISQEDLIKRYQAQSPIHQHFNSELALSTNKQNRNKRQLMGSLISFGRQQSGGITHTLDRFIKPIRDFFHGYTCSHHRSVEYMVESMYYEHIPQARKLDRDFVCQMVGYKCSDYHSFKRGHCFKCQSEDDCRAFTMSIVNIRSNFDTQSKASRGRSMQPFNMMEKFNDKLFVSGQMNNRTAKFVEQISKRILPTFNQYNQNYLPQRKSQYYFDTKPFKDFCLHHYNIFVKYRWFRVRDNVDIEAFRIQGTLTNITKRIPTTFNKFTYQSYTMLLTEANFLGQIESLLILGEKIKSSLVDYIEITYMSNLDARIRSLGSARLCRSSSPFTDSLIETSRQAAEASLFLRCSGSMV